MEGENVETIVEDTGAIEPGDSPSDEQESGKPGAFTRFKDFLLGRSGESSPDSPESSPDETVEAVDGQPQGEAKKTKPGQKERLSRKLEVLSRENQEVVTQFKSLYSKSVEFKEENDRLKQRVEQAKVALAQYGLEFDEDEKDAKIRELESKVGGPSKQVQEFEQSLALRQQALQLAEKIHESAEDAGVDSSQVVIQLQAQAIAHKAGKGEKPSIERAVEAAKRLGVPSRPADEASMKAAQAARDQKQANRSSPKPRGGATANPGFQPGAFKKFLAAR